ncbi:MAG: MBL fold metallo-hydrolase [Gammaproteobacteria bacterium]|nr:MBL fold metallo-hydrolase [Gammaproteobacteria bacterium]
MTVKIPYRRELTFEYGRVDTVAPGIRRVIAKNPSPFTFHGTGTYILGQGEVAVIDPGPLDPEHIRNVMAAIANERVTHILITHTHMDHSPGAALIKAQTGARTFGFGPHGAGKIAAGVVVEEGGDMDFVPDVKVGHGEIIAGGSWSVECVYTPGHTSNHLCFQLIEQKALFTGDHIMGWSTSIISPPDGDMAAYMKSLELMLERDDRVYWPTHGPCIEDPKTHVRAFITHRQERQQQIVDCMRGGVSRIADMVPRMYTDTPEFMYPAAGRSVFAALEYMVACGLARTKGTPTLDGQYFLN